MSDHNMIDPNIIIPFHKISKKSGHLPHFSINLHCVFTLISILFKRKGPTLNIYILVVMQRNYLLSFYPYFLPKIFLN